MGNVVALYIRLSVEDAKVESMSIQNQRLALHKFVESLDELADYEVQEFVDNGHSGTNFERPAIQELLDGVREGKVKCIIVKDFSRFGRDSLEVGYFMEKVFPLYGVRFISINDDFDSAKLHGDTGGINVAFKYLISEFYSRDLSQKYKSAKYVKFKRGEYQSKICPYGYQKSEDGRMEPDPETAPIVRFIFETAVQTGTTTAIIKALFERGVPTPGEYKASKGQNYHDVSRTGHIWQRSTLVRMLADERYTGVYIMGKRRCVEVGSNHVRMKDESEWIKIPDHHPALISHELYEQVQKQFHHGPCVKKNKKDYLLRDKAFCGCCRHALRRIGNKAFRFVCVHSKPDSTALCHGLTIRESELEPLVYETIVKQAQAVLGTALSGTNQQELLFARQDEYSRQVRAIQEQKRALFERLVLDEISETDYKEQKSVFDQEATRVQQLHEAVTTQLAQVQMDEQTKSARNHLAQKVVDTGKLSAELVDALIERVHVFPGNQVEIVWKMRDFALEASEF